MSCYNKQFSIIQFRRGLEADFVSSNIVLASGEPAYAVDTATFKIGDGVTPWNNLLSPASSGSYFISASGDNFYATSGNFSDLTINGSGVTTLGYVNNLLSANDAMLFKGTLGVGGTVTALPTNYETGWTYKVTTAGTYAGNVCEIGDLIIAIVDRLSGGGINSDWVVAQTNLIPEDIVYTTGDQLISGVKTFNSGIFRSVGIRNNTPAYDLDVNGSGNFASGLYVNGIQILPTPYTSDSSSNIVPIFGSNNINEAGGTTYYNTICGGTNNTMQHGFNNFIGAGHNNNLLNAENSIILGGSDNQLGAVNGNALLCSILGGSNNIITHGCNNLHIIGSGITSNALESNTTIVNSLRIHNGNLTFPDNTTQTTAWTNPISPYAIFESTNIYPTFGDNMFNTTNVNNNVIYGGSGNTLAHGSNCSIVGCLNVANGSNNIHIIGSGIIADSGNSTYVNNITIVDGLIRVNNIPTSDPGITGVVWCHNGALKVSGF